MGRCLGKAPEGLDQQTVERGKRMTERTEVSGQCHSCCPAPPAGIGPQPEWLTCRAHPHHWKRRAVGQLGPSARFERSVFSGQGHHNGAIPLTRGRRRRPAAAERRVSRLVCSVKLSSSMLLGGRYAEASMPTPRKALTLSEAHVLGGSQAAKRHDGRQGGESVGTVGGGGGGNHLRGRGAAVAFA